MQYAPPKMKPRRKPQASTPKTSGRVLPTTSILRKPKEAAMRERLNGHNSSDELPGGAPTHQAAPDPRPEKPACRFTGEIPPALAHLRDEPCWVAWGYVWKNGRWTKPPFNPRTGRPASISDPATWATFDVAVDGADRHVLAGVGLVLTGGDIIGIDLDDCITDAGTFSPLAAEIIGYGESYAEVSPSGEGIRIFIRGKIESALKDDATGVEVYSTGRYLTVTGDQVDGTPSEIRLAPRTLDKLTAIVGGAREAKRPKSNGKVHAAGDDFFANVNAAALANLDDWVPHLHPAACKQPNGAWRVSSKDLGRDLEEDLSYHPDGIRDHGEEHGLTPINAVQRYGRGANAVDAALWLCQRMGIGPASLGWRGKQRTTEREINQRRAGADKPSQATVLADIAGGEKVELFRTPDGVPYADLYISGHRETWPVRSKAFKWWLRGVYYERTRSAPNSEAMTTALDLIEARAHFGGIVRPVYLRVAEYEGCIYVNLCDTAWRAVEISHGSWCVVDEPPVRFCRRSGMLELPEPVRGGKLDELDKHLRMGASGYVLTKAWLLAALRPRGPYPVLAFTGEQGTAKSTALRMLRHLVDPNTAPLRAPPDTTRDLYVAAINGHVITLDNVTSLTADVSDALCRLSTGGGFSTRSLYTNDEELLFDGQRPVGMTSIAEAAVRPDLLDRTLGVRLEVIPDNDRKLEDELWAAFDAARPRILGALYDALAHGLKHLEGTRPNRLPRMADFARWSIACEPAYQAAGTFMAAYDEYREEAIDIVLDGDLVADALRRHMKACPPGAFGFAEIETTSKELLELLTAIVTEPQRRSRSWPQTPEGLAHRLIKLAPALRQAGIVIKRGSRQGRRRPIVICDRSSRE